MKFEFTVHPTFNFRDRFAETHTSLGPIGLWIGLITGLTVAGVLHNIRFYYITSE